MRLAFFVALALVFAVISGEAPATTVAAATPTFNTDIAPILYENCASCHRTGEVAPFPLLTYEDAVEARAADRRSHSRTVMPPWKAEPGHGTFLNERRLTDSADRAPRGVGGCRRSGRRPKEQARDHPRSRRLADR